ncbi:MAG: nucleotidyl transferase AbiEii/AbiGii toxin family protein [Succiniclasticum sp.]|nr:nucleotidyl transferase AbiEii/AbiGii toxin family protein [Succiniclasticum sp.]MDY6087475.1 nucleotidyl transferase AbiEii/AbiGii toxin family protein [Succiniclasticum sp.]
MNSLVKNMISAYPSQNVYEKKNAVKEVMQEIVLCGLSRAGFFKGAAFYGGTALRMFYGLNRFSEDLDFSLTKPDDKFNLSDYFPMLEKEIKAFGFNVVIEEKNKSKDTAIKSAFLKGNTREHLLLFYADNDVLGIHDQEMIKIKLEIDVNPPAYAAFEKKFRLQPVPYEINLYDEGSLFAGKLHAVIGRAWKNRVKGRDLYDYVFYLSKGAKCNLKYLQARLIQSGHLDVESPCSIEDVKKMLKERFEQIDYEQAKKDVEPFILDPGSLDLWSKVFFVQITENLKS